MSEQLSNELSGSNLNFVTKSGVPFEEAAGVDRVEAVPAVLVQPGEADFGVHDDD